MTSQIWKRILSQPRGLTKLGIAIKVYLIFEKFTQEVRPPQKGKK